SLPHRDTPFCQACWMDRRLRPPLRGFRAGIVLFPPPLQFRLRVWMSGGLLVLMASRQSQSISEHRVDSWPGLRRCGRNALEDGVRLRLLFHPDAPPVHPCSLPEIVDAARQGPGRSSPGSGGLRSRGCLDDFHRRPRFPSAGKSGHLAYFVFHAPIRKTLVDCHGVRFQLEFRKCRRQAHDDLRLLAARALYHLFLEEAGCSPLDLPDRTCSDGGCSYRWNGHSGDKRYRAFLVFSTGHGSLCDPRRFGGRIYVPARPRLNAQACCGSRVHLLLASGIPDYPSHLSCQLPHLLQRACPFFSAIPSFSRRSPLRRVALGLDWGRSWNQCCLSVRSGPLGFSAWTPEGVTRSFRHSLRNGSRGTRNGP